MSVLVGAAAGWLIWELARSLVRDFRNWEARRDDRTGRDVS